MHKKLRTVIIKQQFRQRTHRKRINIEKLYKWYLHIRNESSTRAHVLWIFWCLFVCLFSHIKIVRAACSGRSLKTNKFTCATSYCPFVVQYTLLIQFFSQFNFVRNSNRIRRKYSNGECRIRTRKKNIQTIKEKKWKWKYKFERTTLCVRLCFANAFGGQKNLYTAWISLTEDVREFHDLSKRAFFCLLRLSVGWRKYQFHHTVKNNSNEEPNVQWHKLMWQKERSNKLVFQHYVDSKNIEHVTCRSIYVWPQGCMASK